jgi:hypothetical protein
MEVMVELRWCRRCHVVVGATGGVWQQGTDGKLASTMMKLPRELEFGFQWRDSSPVG